MSHVRRALASALLFVVFGTALMVRAEVQAPVSENLPYYGAEFYQMLRSGARDEELKQALQSILRSAHLRTPGAPDQIVPNCSGANCVRHVSIGYNRARAFLLGGFYLVNGKDGYAVRDVYCEHEYGPREFRERRPGPNVIPDDRVVNVEHTWPQSKFNKKIEADMQKSDLHHLYPTDSKMNSDRSSHPFGEVVQEKEPLKCRNSRLGRIAESNGMYFEPPERHKGNVARSLFYFAIKYGMNLDPIQEPTLRKWNQQDPVDDEERERNRQIEKLQGSRNPFVDHPELVELIRDL